MCELSVRKDAKVKKMYAGSINITNQVFLDAYKDSNSTEFQTLASQVTNQVRGVHIRTPASVQPYMADCLIALKHVYVVALQLSELYSTIPQLSKYYVDSTVQAFRYGH